MKKVALKKVKPRALASTKTQGVKAGSDKNYTTAVGNLKDQGKNRGKDPKEQIQLYGNFVIPENSITTGRLYHPDPYKERIRPFQTINIEGMRTDFQISRGQETIFLTAFIKESNFHNCACHKLVAFCFFEWTPEGKYRQIPLIEGHPETTNLVIGEVNEIHIDKG